MELERQNPHWEKDFFYPYPLHRAMFTDIYKAVKQGLITAIYGLRRVGKSTILKQVINAAIKDGVKREHILYFSFDESDVDFWKVIRAYEKFIGHRISSKHYILLDEIQKVPKWKEKVKLLYDTTKARILLSGSNSSLMRKGGESLAGRIYEFFLSELSFKEFLYFRNKAELYNSNLDEALEQQFWQYLGRPFPELALSMDIDAQQYTASIVRKVVYEDLPSVFPIDEPQLLYKLFTLIANHPGMLVEYSHLASDLGRDRKTISAYLDYLSYGFLVRRVFNFSKNRLTSEKRLKKFYPTLAAFAKADESEIIETVVAQILKARFFWSFKHKYEVDFIIEEPLYAFEVKYSDKVATEHFKGLRKFGDFFDNAKLILVSKRFEREGDITIVPYYRLEQFLERYNLLRSSSYGLFL